MVPPQEVTGTGIHLTYAERRRHLLAIRRWKLNWHSSTNMPGSNIWCLVIRFVQSPVMDSAGSEVTLSRQRFIQSVFRDGFHHGCASTNVVLQGNRSSLAIYDSMLDSQVPSHRPWIRPYICCCQESLTGCSSSLRLAPLVPPHSLNADTWFVRRRCCAMSWFQGVGEILEFECYSTAVFCEACPSLKISIHAITVDEHAVKCDAEFC